ncbi:MAG: N-acetylmuramoyl-L-alanine amidase family protein [Lachnospiraceae bacterium]|nr:N-acetylmuramoyl-L-alanine amidase family protein [Lachnospiraceae bacterium]
MSRFFRILSAGLLALLLAAGLLPAGTFVSRAAGGGAPSLDSGSSVLALDAIAPGELGTYPADVYGMSDGRPFLLSEQNELALLVGDAGAVSMYFMDDFDLHLTGKDSDGQCWVNGINTANAGSIRNLPATQTEAYKDMKGIQSIAVDRDGTGRKQYIASVGFDEGVVKVVFQNALTGKVRIYALTTASWSTDIPYWLTDNYLAITAGDYDGDGIDSVIVYACGDGDDVRLWEYTPSTASDGWTKRTVLKLSSVLTETRFQTDGGYRFKPAVSLATGDFTGDGRDQLAFSAGFYNTSNDIALGYSDYGAEQLEDFATCVGTCDCKAGSGWSVSSTTWMYDKSSTFTMNGAFRTYPVAFMHAGVIAAGDVDNDGIDEIVAAGYASRLPEEDTETCSRATYSGDVLGHVDQIYFMSEKLVAAVVSYDPENGYVRTSLQSFEMSRAQKYAWKKYCEMEDWAFVKLTVACGKTNGCSAAEDVFISGVLYDFSGLTPVEKYGPSFLCDTDLAKTSGGGAANSSVTWIRNVAAGNFDGNEAGREQFVFTLWQKYAGKNQYSANVGVLAGVEYDDQKDSSGSVTSYGTAQFYACSLKASEITNSNLPVTGNSRTASQLIVGGNNCINAVPVAVDLDDDGILGKFSRSGYLYTDPEVIVVLEAGPYFSEVDAAGGYEDPCQTSYSISVGYGTAASRGDRVSFEVGIALEAAGPGAKMSLEEGYSLEWSHSYETSYTVTSTTSFHAQSEDIVVISRVPLLVYTYDLWDPVSGEWKKDAYNVRVPLAPRYFSLSIQEYNRFVDSYNAMVGKDSVYALVKIVEGKDLPADHLGNPENYWSSWSLAGTGAKKLSAGDYALPYVSGSVSSEYTVETAEAESRETSHGFHFGLTVQVGGSIGLGEAWAGVGTTLGYGHTTGYTKTKVETTATGGQVQNIKASLLGMTGEEMKPKYAFTWNFGKWTRTLQADGKEVPFYGYTVFGVTRQEMTPEIGDFSGTASEGYAAFAVPFPGGNPGGNLTVTKVSGPDAIGFDAQSRCIAVSAGLKTGTYTAEFAVSNGLAVFDTAFTFTLTVSSATGWVRDGTRWRYLREDGTFTANAWEKVGGKWYHFDRDGYMQTGWLKISGTWYYLDATGAMVTGWKQLDGKWYYFEPSGAMAVGWKQIGGKYYFFSDSGSMVTGWKQIDGVYYLFADSGAMQTGWKLVDGKYYYLGSSGAMATGWRTIGGVRYYFKSTGAMATGWTNIDGKTYFFKASGAMAAGEWCQGYWLNTDGTWTYTYKASWRKDSTGWWYGDTGGWYAKNTTITIDGKAYTFDARGYWVE